MKANAIQPERHGHGLGAAYGTVVHRCIEALGKGLKPDRLRGMATIAAQEAGLEEQYIDRAVETVQTIINSDLWKRSMRAKRRLFEVSFVLTRSAIADTHASETAAALVLLRLTGKNLLIPRASGK